MSSAQIFFDLFDRQTAINNSSTEGRKLVSNYFDTLFSLIRKLWSIQNETYI